MDLGNGAVGQLERPEGLRERSAGRLRVSRMAEANVAPEGVSGRLDREGGWLAIVLSRLDDDLRELSELVHVGEVGVGLWPVKVDIGLHGVSQSEDGAALVGAEGEVVALLHSSRGQEMAPGLMPGARGWIGLTKEGKCRRESPGKN